MVFVSSNFSFAVFDTGAELLAGIKSDKNNIFEYAATGYMSAMLQTFINLGEFNDCGIINSVCIPVKSISSLQAVSIVKKYLENNPKMLHLPAWYLVLFAFEQAFPCADAPAELTPEGILQYLKKHKKD